MCPVQWRSHGAAGFLDLGRPAQHVRDADRDDSAGHRPDQVDPPRGRPNNARASSDPQIAAANWTIQ
jgi:hypothetical protein